MKKVKKSYLVWLLKSEKIRVSPDIKRRYINIPDKKLAKVVTEKTNGLWKSNVISKGDYVIVVPSCRKAFFYGRVIEFRIYDTNWKKFKVVHSQDMSLDVSKFMCMSLDPAYKICDQIPSVTITEIDMLSKSLKLSHYLCHADEKLNFNDREVETEIERMINL